MACDKHVVKMTCETAQLLSTVHPPALAPYKHTHLNHPCAKWARYSLETYQWLLRYGINLGIEFTYRYGKTHKSAIAIKKLAGLGTSHIKFKNVGWITPPQVVPDSCKYEKSPGQNNLCPTTYAYRRHYILNCEFAEWNHTRQPPAWWPKKQSKLKNIIQDAKPQGIDKKLKNFKQKNSKLNKVIATLGTRDFNQQQFKF